MIGEPLIEGTIAMLGHILIACGLVVLTTLVHAAAMVGALRVLYRLRIERLPQAGGTVKGLVVAVLVIVMFVASFIEAAMWAATYMIVGATSGFEESMYFSTVTYTTLGFGDIVLDEHWRLLSALEAANGIVMLGWTTALIFASVQFLYLPRAQQSN